MLSDYLIMTEHIVRYFQAEKSTSTITFFSYFKCFSSCVHTLLKLHLSSSWDHSSLLDLSVYPHGEPPASCMMGLLLPNRGNNNLLSSVYSGAQGSCALNSFREVFALKIQSCPADIHPSTFN